MKRIYNMQMCSLIFMKCYLLTHTIISKRKWNNINFRIQRMIIRFYLISLSSITDITMISEILFSVIGMVIFFILECYFKNQIHWHKDFNSFIQSNRTTHFDRNYFLSDSECPQTEDPHRNFGSPKQIREKIKKTNHSRVFEATKIPMGVLRLGTLRIREKIKWDASSRWSFGPNSVWGSSVWGHSESARKINSESFGILWVQIRTV